MCLKRLGCPASARYEQNPSGRDDIRPEDMISVRNRRYPSGIDRIRCLKPLTFVIDVMNVDGGDERLTAHPDALIQNGFSSFRCQTETRSNLPNLADPPPPNNCSVGPLALVLIR